MKVAVVIIAGLALSTSNVEAVPIGTIEVMHNGFTASSGITVWGAGQEDWTTRTGIHRLITGNGTGTGEAFAGLALPAICVELNQYVSQETNPYNVVFPQDVPVPMDFLGDGMGLQKARYIQELWGRYFDPAWTGANPTAQQHGEAEAFAAAIWEIVYNFQIHHCCGTWSKTAHPAVLASGPPDSARQRQMPGCIRWTGPGPWRI